MSHRETPDCSATSQEISFRSSTSTYAGTENISVWALSRYFTTFHSPSQKRKPISACKLDFVVALDIHGLDDGSEPEPAVVTVDLTVASSGGSLGRGSEGQIYTQQKTRLPCC
jgi:hypothetical protein